MSQATKRVAIYCRVSTEDQNSDRQERDLVAFAQRAGYEVVEIFHETASGAKNDRAVRAKVLKLAKGRYIDAILVTELTRWGRTTIDLLDTLKQLATWEVSVIAQTGLDLDLSTPQGKLMLTIMAGLSEFERDLIAERVKSGMQAAKARGIHVGRPVGNKAIDKHTSKVNIYLSEGKTVRWIADQLQISPTTVMAIKKAS